MLDAAQFRALVSGERRGPLATATRAILRAAEVPYTWGVAHRNRRYDAGRAAVHRVEVPVVSVGNLTLGGTGKTPAVAWLARWFRQKGTRVAIVSRGYGAEAGARNDEALELEQRLADVPLVQNADRVAAARVAIDELDAELLVADDAFQHRRLARDLDLVLLDALEPFGYQHVFPRGMLREPPEGLARADVVALSRADLVSADARAAVRRRVASLAPAARWIETRHAPERLLSAAGSTAPLAVLAEGRVAAFCGIGNPEGFRQTLAACGCRCVAWREFPDHHAYARDDIASLAAWARQHEADRIVSTHKDLVKIGVEQLGGCPLWALAIGWEVLEGGERLEAMLRDVHARTVRRG